MPVIRRSSAAATASCSSFIEPEVSVTNTMSTLLPAVGGCCTSFAKHPAGTGTALAGAATVTDCDSAAGAVASDDAAAGSGPEHPAGHASCDASATNQIDLRSMTVP